MEESDWLSNSKIRRREVVYENPFQRVHKIRTEMGAIGKDIYVTDYGHRVGVVVEGPKGILLTRQYRHLIDRLSWEIPGGKVDQIEGLEDAARRECMEETGILCGNLVPLIAFQPGLDTLYNPTSLFHTQNFESNVGRTPVHEDEVVGIEWVPLEKCVSMISFGVIVDSLSVIGLLSYQVLIKKK